jgi:hypothetical protein
LESGTSVSKITQQIKRKDPFKKNQKLSYHWDTSSFFKQL